MPEKEHLELLISDAFVSLGRTFKRCYRKIYGLDHQDFDDLDRMAIEAVEQLGAFKGNAREKIAYQIYDATNDIDLACMYSLAQANKLYQQAKKQADQGRLESAFFLLLRTERRLGVFQSFIQHARLKSRETKRAAQAKLAEDPR